CARPRSSILVVSGGDTVFFFQAEDGIRDWSVTGVQTCALPICRHQGPPAARTRLGGDEGGFRRRGSGRTGCEDVRGRHSHGGGGGGRGAGGGRGGGEGGGGEMRCENERARERGKEESGRDRVVR